MDSNHPSNPSADATTAFEHGLSELILTAFGRGASIEEIWEIPGPVSDAPSWRVTIEKVPPTEVTYEPTCLEE